MDINNILVLWANRCSICCAFLSNPWRHDFPAGQRPSALSELHFKFLLKTTVRHLNCHLDLPIYRLLNTCGTLLEGTFTPEMTSTTFGNLRLHCWRNGSTYHDDHQIDQHYEETLHRCDRQKRLPYATLRLVWLIGCDLYLALMSFTHY